VTPRSQSRPDAELTAAQLEILRGRAVSLAHEDVEEQHENRISVLLFSLGEEWYCVNIDDVREIYNEYRVAAIPCVPGFIQGVINIRGEIVSVTDLRVMLSLGGSARPASDEQPPVIVVADQRTCTALLVDTIGDIVEVPADSIEPPLSLSDKSQAEFVSGQLYVGGNLVALVNLSKVLAPVGASE
jgi:purine-binding chemotaxis protein CheW